MYVYITLCIYKHIEIHRAEQTVNDVWFANDRCYSEHIFDFWTIMFASPNVRKFNVRKLRSDCIYMGV